MQTKWGSHGDYQVIAYSPWSVQEMYDMTIAAFNMAERYRIPTFVLGDEATGHLREKIDIPVQVEVYDRVKQAGAAAFDTEEADGVPPMPSFGDGERLLVTGSTHNGFGFRKTDDADVQARLVRRLHRKIMDHRDEIVEVERYHCEGVVEVAVISYGFTARSALFAVQQLRSQGVQVGMVRLKTLWPFADTAVSEVSRRSSKILVPEMNMGQVAGEVMKYASCEVCTYNQTNGEVISPRTIEQEVKRIL